MICIVLLPDGVNGKNGHHFETPFVGFFNDLQLISRGGHGRDRMVVGFL